MSEHEYANGGFIEGGVSGIPLAAVTPEYIISARSLKELGINLTGLMTEVNED